tara:strand:+ start:1358 stop:1876 length:519 start_codon:yes stop_codon:yes gene_type:complete
MERIDNEGFFRRIISYGPVIVLFVSVLNKIDLNYLNLKFFSFNFVYILIFYWTLKDPKSLRYGAIFFAGLINDVVLNTPIGLSSFNYLLICGVTAYMRNITLRPSAMNDWVFFLVVILIINSISFVAINIIYSVELSYIYFLVNSGMTFLLYPIFSYLFNIYKKLFILKSND